MNVEKLKGRLESVADDMEVIVEAGNGKKFRVLTAKVRPVRVGHKKSGEVFWIATGEPVKWRDL